MKPSQSVINRLTLKCVIMICAEGQLDEYNREGKMTADERAYRSFLSESLKAEKNPERKLGLRLEIDRLDWMAWEERTICKTCGGKIPLDKMEAHLRTEQCWTCQRIQKEMSYSN